MRIAIEKDSNCCSEFGEEECFTLKDQDILSRSR